MANQLASQPHQPRKRSRWLFIIIIVACILTVLSFIGATIFWIGLVHDKLSDTLGAIFTALGTIFGFIALVLAIPPFIQYLQEHRSVTSPTSVIEPKIEPTPGAKTTIDHQTYFIQPGWNVHGDVTQAQGDINIIASDAKQSSTAPRQLFTDLKE